MAGKTTINAARVGLLVIVFITALLFGLHFLGTDFGGAKNVYSIQTPDATGISPGANVLLAGVPIGHVTKVSLASPTLANISIVMKRNQSLPRGSVAIFPTSLTGFGDAIIKIEILHPEYGNLISGSIIQGYRQGPLASFLPDAKSTLENLNKTLASANALLADPKLKKSLLSIVQTGDTTLGQLSALAAKTQLMLKQNQYAINSAVQNAAVAIVNVRKGSQMALDLLRKGDYQKEAMALLKSLNATGAKAQKLIDNLNAFVSDPKLRSGIDATVQNSKDLTDQGKKIAGSVQKIADNGAQVSHEAIALTKNANDVAVEAKSLVRKVSNLVDKVSGKVNSISKKRPIGKITAEADLFHESTPNHWRTDFNFEVPINNRSLYLGVYDAFGSNQLNFQLGQNLSKNFLVRYGAYAGKLGLGVNYSLGTRLGLVGDLFNVNDPTFNLGARYDFGSGFIGFVGYDQLFDRNRLTLGVGYRK